MRLPGPRLPNTGNRSMESEAQRCVIDTSVVFRYLTGERGELAERARRIIESAMLLILTETADSV